MNAKPKTECDLCGRNRTYRCQGGWIWNMGSEYPCNRYMKPLVKPVTETREDATQSWGF